MPTNKTEGLVRLDLNNPTLRERLFALHKPERLAALETFAKLSRLTWSPVYGDKGLHWEKIASVKPPAGVAALYGLRITRSRRATAYRDGDFVRLLTIAPDHDSTYGKK